jgi:hypothetical protein
VPKYVIEITLPRIEYVKSAALVVESDELKVIALGSFIESKIAKRLLSRQAGNVAPSSPQSLIENVILNLLNAYGCPAKTLRNICRSVFRRVI